MMVTYIHGQVTIGSSKALAKAGPATVASALEAQPLPVYSVLVTLSSPGPHSLPFSLSRRTLRTLPLLFSRRVSSALEGGLLPGPEAAVRVPQRDI